MQDSMLLENMNGHAVMFEVAFEATCEKMHGHAALSSAMWAMHFSLCKYINTS